MATVAITTRAREERSAEQQDDISQQVPTEDSTPPSLDPPRSVWHTAPNICIAVFGLVIAIPGIVWAVKSYNVAVFANQLSQQESCRAHPNNPFLQASSTCRAMHAAGDYDHDVPSKRGLTSLAKRMDDFYSQSMTFLFEHGWMIAWVMYQSLSLAFFGYFCLSMCWPHRLRYAICASRRDLCIMAFIMSIDIARVGLETIASKAMFLVALYVADISKDGESGVPVHWFRILGYVFVFGNAVR